MQRIFAAFHFVMVLVLSQFSVSCDGNLSDTCAISNPCTSVIDYDQSSIEKMLHDVRADYVDPSFTSSNYPFKSHGTITKDLVFVEVEVSMSTEELIAEIAERSLELANLEDMLAFGAQYPPGMVWERPIVVFGSDREDSPGVWVSPCLDVIERDSRNAFTAVIPVYSNEPSWQTDTRILAVRP